MDGRAYDRFLKEIKEYILEEVDVDYFKKIYSNQELHLWIKNWKE